MGSYDFHGWKCLCAIFTIKLGCLSCPGLSGYLDESGLVTEPVVAVLAHAVEVGLVLAVVAVGELAILVEPGDGQID